MSPVNVFSFHQQEEEEEEVMTHTKLTYLRHYYLECFSTQTFPAMLLLIKRDMII